MSKHIEEAKEYALGTVGETDRVIANSLVGINHALIAIAEQLQLANRIALHKSDLYGEELIWDCEPPLKPEIAELLGVDHEA